MKGSAVSIFPPSSHLDFFMLFCRLSGSKGTEIFSAQGVRPVPDGTESAGTTMIPERLLAFRKAPVPDPFAENRIPAPIRPTKS
jgi:hypothetical protein